MNNEEKILAMLEKHGEMLERMPEDFPEDYAKATQLALEKIREGDAQVVLN